MRGTRFGITALGLSVLGLVLTGCGGGKKSDDEPDGPPIKVTKDGKKGGSTNAGGGPASGKPVRFVKDKARTVTGKVTLAGTAPNVDELNAELLKTMKDKADQMPFCLDSVAPKDKDQTEEQDWRPLSIKTGEGVADVFVFLRPASGTYFACEADDPGVKAHKDETVYVHQPHCAFLPHALFLFPSYADAKGKMQSTGQKFIVTNESKTGHNLQYGDSGGPNPGSNISIDSGREKEIPPMEPSNQSVSMSCKIHGWMSANAWVVDHPYYAITDKNGNFEIKNAPAGKVQIAAWHSVAKFLNSSKFKGEPLDLTEQDGKYDFVIRAK